MNRMRKSKLGFTLMELMVVIAILGLLVTLVAPNVWNVFRQGNVRTAQSQIKNFEGAIGQYRSVNGGGLRGVIRLLVTGLQTENTDQSKRQCVLLHRVVPYSKES